MKLDNFKRIEDYEAEREKKELEFIIQREEKKGRI